MTDNPEMSFQRKSLFQQGYHHFSEAELARSFDTIDALRSHPAIQEFIGWLAGKPADWQDNRSGRPGRFGHGCGASARSEMLSGRGAWRWAAQIVT